MTMFERLEEINLRPEVFGVYTAQELWTDEYTSGKMLAYHLNEDVDAASRSGAFIDKSVEWICWRFGVTAGTKIADFGCGPGLYARRLAKRGAAVTGIDFSANSIEYARKAALDAGVSVDYVNADYLEYETGERFDLIIMIMCDFCALGPGQRRRLLGKFREFLAPGGAVLLDVYSLAGYDKREECAVYQENLLGGFWAEGKYWGFLNTFKYDDEKVVCDKYTIVEEGRTRTIYNWLQYFSREAIEMEFAECGFAIEEFLGDVAGGEYDPEGSEFAVAAIPEKGS